VSDNDEPDVSRRQFFRGLGNDLFRAIGEITGLDAEPEPPPMRHWFQGQGEDIVPQEKQSAALSDVFSFLEQLGAREEPEERDPAHQSEAPVEPEARPPSEPL
jgi:hypothetical protein